MAEPTELNSIIQEVIDTRADMQSFNEFMNAAKDVVVARRLALPANSLDYYLNYLDAIKLVFTQANGDVTVGDKTVKSLSQLMLDAAATLERTGGNIPYLTYAAMVADKANITNKMILEVTNDTDALKNGKYTYNGTTFTKADYDPVSLSINAAKEVLRKNEGVVTYNQDAFNLPGGYNLEGVLGESGYEAPRRTAQYPVRAGEVVSITTDLVTTTSAKGVFFTASGQVSHTIKTSVAGSGLATYEGIALVDGFVAAQCAKSSSLGCSISIGVGSKLFVELSSLSGLPEITKKADIKKEIVYDDFEPGTVDAEGIPIPSTSVVRSPTYKMWGHSLTFSRSAGSGLQFGILATAQPETKGQISWYNTGTYIFTSDASLPYVRIFIRNTAGTLDVAAAVSRIRITDKTDVAYRRDVSDEIKSTASVITKRFEEQGEPNISYLFRTPSLAAGGAITFIDDDGRDALYSGLYPFMKLNSIPFGAAIVPDRLGRTVSGAAYITLEQLKDMASDTDYFEVLSHAYSHKNLPIAEQKIRESELYRAKQWFARNGFDVNGFVLPYGNDDAVTRALIMKHYQSCYDYEGAVRPETFSTIRNQLISRTSWDNRVDRVAFHKTLIDQTIALNGWLVITTHVQSTLYWNESSYADLQEVINYIKLKGVKVLRPDDGFQTFGNIVENDSGFKIQANGKIVGAT